MAKAGVAGDFDQMLSFLAEVKSTHNAADLAAVVKRVTSKFGVERILAGYIPRSGTLPSEQLRHVLLADWPEEWANYYFRQGLLFHDPTIKRVLSNSPTFSWTEFHRDSGLEKSERRVMQQAQDFSLRNGCTVPLLSLDHRYAGFSFAGEAIDDSPEAKGMMTLVASFAFGQAIELRATSLRSKVRLTAREREVLSWIASGKTDWEISVIFGVSEKAVAKHVYNARMKLGAVNRAHAVAEAFRLRLIT